MTLCGRVGDAEGVTAGEAEPLLAGEAEPLLAVGTEALLVVETDALLVVETDALLVVEAGALLAAFLQGDWSISLTMYSLSIQRASSRPRQASSLLHVFLSWLA